MSDFKTYDPKDVKVTFNGVELTGFADGTFIKVEREPLLDAIAEVQTSVRRADRKQRRRSRMARKKRRGWA